MEEVGRKKGLIRYASENAIARGYKMVLSQRIIAYSVVLLLLFSGLIYGISSRTSVETSILRAPGLLFQKTGVDSLSNLYNYKIVNKTRDFLKLSITLDELPASIQMVGVKKEITLSPGGLSEGSFFLILPDNAVSKRKTKIEFQIKNGNQVIETYKSVFIGPIQ
jgi:polyferredoxin